MSTTWNTDRSVPITRTSVLTLLRECRSNVTAPFIDSLPDNTWSRHLRAEARQSRCPAPAARKDVQSTSPARHARASSTVGVESRLFRVRRGIARAVDIPVEPNSQASRSQRADVFNRGQKHQLAFPKQPDPIAHSSDFRKDVR